MVQTLFKFNEGKGGGLKLDSFLTCTSLANAKFTMLMLLNSGLLLLDVHSKSGYIKEIYNYEYLKTNMIICLKVHLSTSTRKKNFF